MSKIFVNGGNPLKGEVTISGAKNAAVAILPATILVQGVCKIENVPSIRDVDVMLRILEQLGAKYKKIGATTYEIDTTNVNSYVVPEEMSKQLRASYYLLGALLGRFGKAKVAAPGGCGFCERPIDLHLKAFEALGANVELLCNFKSECEAECKEENRSAICQIKNCHHVDKIYRIDLSLGNNGKSELIGSTINFDVVSVGATVNAILAAVKAKGTTYIYNAAKEPHIVDLANFLNKMGANIRSAGTDTIKVIGVESLKTGETYTMIPDQIEAGTFMVAAAATKGEVTLKKVTHEHLGSITKKLIEFGADVKISDDSLTVKCDGRPRSGNITTAPHPGFPTDMQPQMAVLLSIADGVSHIAERVWSTRFQYVKHLNNMGASITLTEDKKDATIVGVEGLKGAVVAADDLRAGAALIIAGLIAEGTTTIDNVIYIDRGYDDVVGKFKALGADIWRSDDQKTEEKITAN